MRFVLITLSLLIFVSCNNQKENTITDKGDYNKFLKTEPVRTTSKYFELWNGKIRSDSIQLTSFGIVAGEYNRYFQETGDITYLKKAEQALQKAVDIAAIGKADYYRSLARNYISQHRFREALQLADSARTVGSELKESQSLLFDVHMELGNYAKAEKYLDSIKNMSDFGYLIRLAKWNDHRGDLDTAINFMEKATVRAEKSKKKELMVWSYTNLADFYGHAGRIKDSYEHYLKALGIDPENAYAKKGIAWIVFSHEKNPKEALRILDSVTKNYKAPDYYLLKAEIAEYLNDDMERLSNLDKYYRMVDNPSYGEMYNAHNIALFLEQTGQYSKAMHLAKREVKNRETPETYSLLAYAHFKNGNLDTAMKIVEERVKGKTFEPAILLNIAKIYKAAGNLKEVNMLKSELKDAEYELGPLAENRIGNL